MVRKRPTTFANDRKSSTTVRALQTTFDLSRVGDNYTHIIITGHVHLTTKQERQRATTTTDTDGGAEVFFPIFFYFLHVKQCFFVD